MDSAKTPRDLSFYFPAEWEEHVSTWLTYPKPNDSWASNYKAVCSEFNRFVEAMSRAEFVNIIVDNKTHAQEVNDSLSQTGCDMNQIKLHEFGSNDSWCRDHGPAFLRKRSTGERAIVKWEFNAWGGKYPYELDNAIGNNISALYNLPVFRPGIIMEGGSIEVNGKGSLLTTKACLLNKNRNPHLSQTEIENYLCQFYGVDNIIWLNEGVEGDDTDGHIDDISRFVDEQTIITVIEHNRHDSNYSILKENSAILEKVKLENGISPTIIELPMPEPVYLDGERLPASYANFYICNAGVIVPVFGTKTDDKAIDILSGCFKNKKVIPLSSNNIIYGLGSWHCLSQQETK